MSKRPKYPTSTFSNESFLGKFFIPQYTSPTLIIKPSNLSYYSEETAVYATKALLDMLEEMTKCTGQFLNELMRVPGNHLLTIHHKINFDQCAQMLESICKYAEINQKD